MKWTSAQQNVIERKGCDLLVSAAAGSGKTAVLVERIIKKVTDEDHPVDIDHILVVTFTRAAAKEMKERIYDALQDALQGSPDDEHLIRQGTLVHNAPISTIDGFCQSVLKDHFHEIGLDPAAKVADEGEMTLLLSEVMDRVLEECYTEGEEGFLLLADLYSGRDRDDMLAKMVLGLYREAVTHPWPERWLDETTAPYEAALPEELAKSSFIGELLSFAKSVFEEQRSALLSLCEDLCADGSEHPYLDTVTEDLALLERLIEADDYETIQQILSSHRWMRLSGRKVTGEDPEERKRLAERRNRVKEAVNKLSDKLFFAPLSESHEDMKQIAGPLCALVRLTKRFSKAFAEEKRKRKRMDFSDLEHFALRILIDEETGERTAAARELSDWYEEVMIDEYQDSNDLQETLLSAIVRTNSGEHNYFMVGDVKQSIYRFRQARPDIFTEKYRRFGTEENTDEAVIDLDRNFRSRREVTSSINEVFTRTMHPDMGGVEYDEAAQLKFGAEWYPEKEGAFLTELLLCDTDDDSPDSAESDLITEARLTAARIRSLVGTQPVTDKTTGQLRPARYSDIAILHRSANSVGNTFSDVLKEYDIPVFMAQSTGYFSSIEVETTLSALSVIDNPRVDIPLAAVLTSPMFSFSDDLMARIRLTNEEGCFYDALLSYRKQHPEEQKPAEFLAFLDRMRRLARRLPVHGLLEQILSETGYADRIRAMPSGTVRLLNLNKLLDLALAYEKSSFFGLFHFIRTIERMKKYEQDFGEASLLSENDNVVSLLTIHKSKGLEYPIVIVCGMARRIRGNRDSMIISGRSGVGLYAQDASERTKKDTLFRSFLSLTESAADRGEELRILYVAMTRAKEKLILCGAAKGLGSRWENAPENADTMPLYERLTAPDYFAYVFGAAKAAKTLFDVKTVQREELLPQSKKLLRPVLERRRETEEFLRRPDAAMQQKMSESFARKYPFAQTGEYKVKYSVSELKHAAIEELVSDETPAVLFGTEAKQLPRPRFTGAPPDEEYAGALRGTAVHRFLECFDFTQNPKKGLFEAERKRMREANLLTEEYDRLLPLKQLRGFFGSKLAERMHEAARMGLLYREKAFVMGDAPKVFFEEAKEEDAFVLVQGIIDVFFEEEDGIVLLDYKTDRVKNERELTDRYKKQMACYREAIERTHEKKVKEVILYSFALGREVRIDGI